MDLHPDSKPTTSKAPVIRGARACTVCRAAKMKCVGAEDGQKQCQRCKRANVECVFEKHRRGRKPGSKLSEASKMLRRLEKGLNSAKMKSQTVDNSSPYQASDRLGPSQDSLYPTIRPNDHPYGSPSTHFPSNELPPLNLPSYPNDEGYLPHTHASRSLDMTDDDDNDDDDADPNNELSLSPTKLIRRENQRNSFFRTILNPEESPDSGPSNRGSPYAPPQNRLAPLPNGLNDPITAGIIKEEDAKMLFDLIYLRLNPFINLFDPALHSVTYVRSKCPFLFTTLIMAGCKFFKPEIFKPCQRLAYEFAVRAFAETWKRVEVIQAFACLTYWKDPDDNRTWTYIGYACRMAIELGLNRYVPNPSTTETEFQRLERRNRERTYLVLFVHDRSLSILTGRHWMLPEEDDLVRNSATWHEGGGTSSIRPEDVIVAAFVSLRRIAAETTNVFGTSKGTSPGVHHDVNYEAVLRNCNAKLTLWADTWQHEMGRARGEKFHSSFLTFFRLHVRLFLNSFGIQAAMSPSSRQSPSLQALTTCSTSAIDSLRIVSHDFAKMSMLRYGQDSITIMTAYSAVFLLKLLRSSNTFSQLKETAHDIHVVISETANAYQDASQLCLPSTSAAYHARFLRSLVSNDVFRARRNDQKGRHDASVPIDPRLQSLPSSNVPMPSQNQTYPNQVQQPHEQSFHFPASPHLPAHPAQGSELSTESSTRNTSEWVGTGGVGGSVSHHGHVPHVPHHASELDAHYWKNMFIELGFGENPEGTNIANAADTRGIPHYLDSHHQQQTNLLQHQGSTSYQHLPNYDH